MLILLLDVLHLELSDVLLKLYNPIFHLEIGGIFVRVYQIELHLLDVLMQTQDLIVPCFYY